MMRILQEAVLLSAVFEFEPSVSHFLQSLSQQMAGVVVMVGGIIYAVISHWRCPAAARLVITALTIMLLATIGSVFVSSVLVNMMSTQQLEMSHFQTISSMLWLVTGLLRSLALALLIAAVFVQRQPTVDDHFDE